MKHHSNLVLCLLIVSMFAFAVVSIKFSYSEEPRTLIWHFDEGVGRVAKEATGSGNDANFNEGEGIKWVEGKFNSALEFSGSDADPQWLEVSYSDDVDIIDAVTMQAWVYPTSLPGDKRTIVTKASYYLQLEPTGQISTYFYDVTPPGYHLSLGKVNEKEWTHVAVTYDGKDIRFYINGEEDNKVIRASGKIRHRTDWDLHLGGEKAKPHCCPRYFQGIIDEIKLSNFAMAAEQIKESMKGSLAVNSKGKLATCWSYIKKNS